HREGGLPGLSGRRVPERHPEAREELADREGLADVVIRAGVERGHLVAFLPSGREHDDRHLAPLAQAADHLEAVDVWQAHVQDEHVGLAASLARYRGLPAL